MKVLSHVIALAIGFGLGLFVTRQSAPPPEPVVAESKTPEASSPANPSPPSTASMASPSAPDANPQPVPTTSSTAVDVSRLKADFDKYIAKDDLQSAYRLLVEMQKADPRGQAYLESQGVYLKARGDLNSARAAFKTCLASYAQSHTCMVQLADLELEIGSEADQSEAVRQCMAFNPSDPQCKNLSARLSLQKGDYNSAITMYQELLRNEGIDRFRFNPGVLDWHLGLALEGAGRQPEALTQFEKSCQAGHPRACDKLEELSGGGVD